MGPLRRLHAAFPILAALTAVSQPAFADSQPDSATTADLPRVEAAPEAPETTPRYRLAPVVVTAERIPIVLDRVPSDVFVIPGERMDRRALPLLADELREAPAVDVQRSGSLGKLSDVRLRGADPRHTLVLFDGIPLNGPWAGTFDFADLPATGWGRVEVMGGPASSLYGSGAVGGVIQVLSPDASETSRLRLSGEMGELGTTRQSVDWSRPVGSAARVEGAPGSGARGPGALGASVSRLTSDGLGARDAYEGHSGRIHAALPAGRARIQMSGLVTRGVKEIRYDYRFDPSDFSTRQVRDPNARETDQIAAGRALVAVELGRRVLLEGDLSGMWGSIDYENPADAGSADYVDTRLDNARWIGGARARLQGPGATQSVIGAEYREERVDRADDSQYGGFPSASRVDRTVHTRSLYGQAHAEWKRLLLDAGFRLDDHARYGARGVPRVAAGLSISEMGMKLRGGYGRAFTAPTLSDLYYPFYGSENLRPERSRTWEAGADGRWADGRLQASATWHTTRFHDLIQSNSFFQAENIGRARIEGMEYSVRVQASSGIALSGRGARLIAKNLDGGARLAKRPAWRAGVSAEAEAGAVSAWAALRWVDSMLDPFVFHDPSGRLLSGDTPGYAALDVGAAFSLDRWVPAEARVRIANALDRRYSEVKGYPAPGRAVTVGISLTP